MAQHEADEPGKKDLGVREVRALAMKHTARLFVDFVISDQAAWYLEKDLGLTSPEQVTPELMDQAQQAVRQKALDTLFSSTQTDTGDQRRLAELLARSIAGFGDRIDAGILTINEGDPRLVALQGFMRVALDGLP